MELRAANSFPAGSDPDDPQNYIGRLGASNVFDSIDRTTESDLTTAVDAERLAAHVDRLAELRRYPGTDDQWAAAEYVTDTLASYGVDAELHSFEGYVSVPEAAAVTVTAPKRLEIEETITTAFSANTPRGGVSGELVRLDSPAAAADLDGAIAFLTGLPTPAAVRQVEAAGASAAIFGSPAEDQLHEMIVSPVWGTPDTDTVDQLPELPVAEIHPDADARLAELVAGDDVHVTVETEVTTELRELPCPVGRIDGTESDRRFMIGNHIDAWHEGVTDNGTAIAATLELARVFADAEPSRGLVFGFWPGHSMGRYAGSAWYADTNWLELRENAVGYLHIDLNGLDGADQIWYQHMAEVGAEHRDVLGTASLPLRDSTEANDLLGATERPGRNSDQSFWGAGVPSLLSGARFSGDHPDAGPVGGGWWWHTPEDTRDKVDMALLAEETQLYTRLAARFCHSPVLPQDHRATCEDIRTTLESIADAAGEQFTADPAFERLAALEEALAAFAATIDDVDGFDHDIEDVQVQLSNLLIPALYMEASEYEHDPALPHDLLGYLRVAEELPDRSGPARRFAEVKATRGVTKLAHRLDQAEEVVTNFLATRA